MSQFGNYQVHPTESITNTPLSKSKKSKKAFQPYVHPLAMTPMTAEDESENPCFCWCGLHNAAKGMVLVNLVVFFLKLIVHGRSLIYGRTLPELFTSDRQVQFLFADCSRLEGPREDLSMAIFWVFVVTWVLMTLVLDFVLPILFGTTVCSWGNVATWDQQVFYSSLYMRYQFCLPGTIVWILYNLAATTKSDPCGRITQLWISLLVGATLLAIISIFSGLVGIAYRDALKRRINLAMKGPAEETPNTGVDVP